MFAAYRQIETELTEMETLARQMLSNVSPFVEEVVRYSFQFGGKRLRPAILLLAGKAMGSMTEQHIRAAAAIEFVHTATLIHDDILDGANIRRHLATVNVKWSAQIAVLAGDMLLTKALEFLTEENGMFGIRSLTEACKKTCEGELRQIAAIGRFDLPLEEYYGMIAGKTAPLLACSAELGAYYSGTDEQTAVVFREFGHQLGLAFQIIDDILDIAGEDAATGKTLRTDLLNRKPTLPLIFYLQGLMGTQRQEVLAELQRENLDEAAAQHLVSDILQSSAVEQSRCIAAEKIGKAVDQISVLEKSEALDGLISIAEFVGKRKI